MGGTLSSFPVSASWVHSEKVKNGPRSQQRGRDTQYSWNAAVIRARPRPVTRSETGQGGGTATKTQRHPSSANTSDQGWLWPCVNPPASWTETIMSSDCPPLTQICCPSPPPSAKPLRKPTSCSRTLPAPSYPDPRTPCSPTAELHKLTLLYRNLGRWVCAWRGSAVPSYTPSHS